ncbi:DUF4142 domain-containing protein [Rubellimicrobium roseum]|uniref:DUF4142 domain-containing protein n=1 Tax=Rubellimicrobium roseum TaxID=687525 RepID=A0A5C4NAD9_9RHOB|nr:DUF4142 domain-containing protein [Rubellimicrobium roseum]TNC64236.1 DUF4142 domain-containing protein [Rubellimicrobium roseum]
MPNLPSAALAVLLTMAPLAVTAQETSEQATGMADVDEFAQAAAQGNLAEVQMSALALQKTNDRRVEEYAWTMLDHHGRAMGDLAESLGEGAALLPSEPSPEQAATLEEMRALEGTEFDEAYLAHQLEAHRAAIALYEQGEQVSDERVATYARTTLPTLRAHLETAQIWQAQPPEPLPQE